MPRSMRRSVMLALGVIAMVVLILGETPVRAGDDHLDQFGPVDIVEMISFPFLPYGEMIDDTGPWYGSITVQNVEDADIRIWVFTDAGFRPEDALGTYMLPPNGAITLSAAALGLDDAGSPLVVAGVFRSIWEADPAVIDDAIDIACDGPPAGTADRDGWLYTCKPAIAGVAKLTAATPLAGPTGNRTTAAHISVDGYNAIPAQDVAWGSQSAFCDAIVAGWPDDCSGIGTYEPFGYGVGFVFDGHSYLPIVQTNAGWNTEIRISNIDPSAWAGQVNVTLIASDQQGHASSAEHKITFEETVLPGESWSLDLRAHGVPDGWVGSAHITANVGVVTYAARVNPEDDMLMINVAAPSTWATTSPGTEFQSADFTHTSEPFSMYAPLVFQGFHGWNTGISIANIDERTNRVSITWHDSHGSIRATDIRTIPPQGQVYVYIPAIDAPSAGALPGWTGSVTLTGEAPFHAVVDQVKYETGEAMSYMATAAGAWAPDNSDAPEFPSHSLALPLIQKGQLDEIGDTSGIQLFNPDPESPVEIEVHFYSQTGALMPPTNAGPIRTTIRSSGHTTIYTMDLAGMIPNSTGTAIVEIVDGTGQVFGITNSVNYAVAGDGSVTFNLVNTHGQYRFPISQTKLP